jgi:hypothetical protein
MLKFQTLLAVAAGLAIAALADGALAAGAGCAKQLNASAQGTAQPPAPATAAPLSSDERPG